MLNAIITWSLRHRFMVLALSALLVLSALTARASSIDAFPDTTPVQVQINTVTPALSRWSGATITFPVEQQSAASRGLAKSLAVQVRFIAGHGHLRRQRRYLFARQLVMERLGTVELPKGLERPTMGPVATGLGEVYHYILTSQSKSLTELRRFKTGSSNRSFEASRA